MAQPWQNHLVFSYICLILVVASVEVKIPNGFGTQHESVCVNRTTGGAAEIYMYSARLTCDLRDVFLVNLRPETLRILSAKLR